MTQHDLVDELAAAWDDPTVSALAIEHDLEPMAGFGTPVAAPTYNNAMGREPERPVSPEAFLPAPDTAGWLSGVLRDETGRPVTAPAVVLDSVPAQAGRAETALWQFRQHLGGLPGFLATAPEDADPDVAGVAVSSWQASHRHADAWLRYATDTAGGAPLWAQQHNAAGALLAGLNSTDDASALFSYAPNSALFGFWMSTGVTRRHRQPRVYRSEIVGYGARPHYSGASKMDAVPSDKDTELSRAEFGMAAKKKQADSTRPSELGFGPVPGNAEVHGFVCERIAARAELSLAPLRAMRYGDDEHEPARRRAASVALLVLGLAGDTLSRQDTLLRSGCDLLPTSSRYGWRVQGQSQPQPVTLPPEASELDWWSQQLTRALEGCQRHGLSFAEPVQLVLSPPQQQVITDAVQRQRGQLDTGEVV